MSTGKVVLGVVAGLAVGAILGILFAPDKGSETRKKISKRGGESVDELEKKFNRFADSAKEKFKTAKEDAGRIAEDSKVKVEGTLHQVGGEVKKQTRY